jgi:hypothetical protein
LVKWLQQTLELASIGRVQHAIDVLQDDAGLIILAVVNVGTVVGIAGG